MSLCPHGACAGPSRRPCPSFNPTETHPPHQHPGLSAKHGQVPPAAHTSSDPCPSSLKIPAFVSPALQAAEAVPRAAGLMRNAWDPHLVVIEPGAVLGREEAQISCSTKEGRGMSVAEQRPWLAPPSQGCTGPLLALLGCPRVYTLLFPGLSLSAAQPPPFPPTGMHRHPTATDHSHGHAVPEPPAWPPPSSLLLLRAPTARHPQAGKPLKTALGKEQNPSETTRGAKSRQRLHCATPMRLRHLEGTRQVAFMSSLVQAAVSGEAAGLVVFQVKSLSPYLSTTGYPWHLGL